MRARTAVLTAAVAAAGGALVARRRVVRTRSISGQVASVAGRATTVATSDGASLAVTESGSGRLVVFAHGWTETQSIWTDVAAELSASGFQVVTYDQRGHGRSTVGSDRMSIARLGQDLHEVLSAFDARGAIVVGHSMGGMTAMSLLGTRPELSRAEVGAAVLVSTSAVSVGSRPRVDAAVARLVGSPLATRAFAGRAGPRLMRGTLGRTPDRAHMAATASLFAGTSGATRRDCFLAMAEMDLRVGLAAVECPVTVVVGERDRLTPPRQAREIVRHVQGAELVVIPDAGHQLPFEAPRQLAKIIKAAAAAASGEGPLVDIRDADRVGIA